MKSVLLVLLLVLLVWAQSASAVTTTITNVQGTEDTYLSSGSTLANNVLLLSAAVTQTNPGYFSAYCTFTSTGFGGVVTSGSQMSGWFLKSTNAGSTYEDGDASTTPARRPDIEFPLRAVSTAQVVGARVDKMPMGFFKLLMKNDGTGQTLNATWSVKCLPYTPQGN
jgi:hypothetical protein